jgi:hypothetical protein
VPTVRVVCELRSWPTTPSAAHTGDRWSRVRSPHPVLSCDGARRPECDANSLAGCLPHDLTLSARDQRLDRRPDGIYHLWSRAHGLSRPFGAHTTAMAATRPDLTVAKALGQAIWDAAHAQAARRPLPRRGGRDHQPGCGRSTADPRTRHQRHDRRMGAARANNASAVDAGAGDDRAAVRATFGAYPRVRERQLPAGVRRLVAPPAPGVGARWSAAVTVTSSALCAPGRPQTCASRRTSAPWGTWDVSIRPMGNSPAGRRAALPLAASRLGPSSRRTGCARNVRSDPRSR